VRRCGVRGRRKNTKFFFKKNGVPKKHVSKMSHSARHTPAVITSAAAHNFVTHEISTPALDDGCVVELSVGVVRVKCCKMG